MSDMKIADYIYATTSNLVTSLRTIWLSGELYGFIAVPLAPTDLRYRLMVATKDGDVCGVADVSFLCRAPAEINEKLHEQVVALVTKVKSGEIVPVPGGRQVVHVKYLESSAIVSLNGEKLGEFSSLAEALRDVLGEKLGFSFTFSC